MNKLKLAGMAAALGCVACCTLPLLGIAGAGSGFGAIFTRVLAPGNELLVAGGLFVTTLVAMTLWQWVQSRSSGCKDDCRLDGSCCETRRSA